MMARVENFLKISKNWIALGGVAALLFSQISCSGCGKKPQTDTEHAPLVFKDDSPSIPTTDVPPGSPAITKNIVSSPNAENKVPEKSLKAQGSVTQSRQEPVAPSARNGIQSNTASPAFDSTGPDPELPSAPSFVDTSKFSQAPVFLPSAPLPAPKNNESPSGFDSGPPPLNLNSGFVSNNNSAPTNPSSLPVVTTSNNVGQAPVNPASGIGNTPPPPLPQAQIVSTASESNNTDTVPLALVHSPTESENSKPNLTAPSTEPSVTPQFLTSADNSSAKNTDTELTVAMAEGVLNSAPESAAMGGGFNYSMLALAFPEETSEARKTKISQGDKSYDLNLPDTQERYKAEIPLSWVLWAVTAGDIHAAVLPDGAINEEEYAKLEFGEVEKPLNGSQDGRLVRVFSCGPLTAPNWNEAWMAMWSNVFGFTPPPPTLADLCSQPMYRDYRISGDKISFDLPVAGRGALMFVTFNPVDWLKPEFQAAVGAKHIEGEPITLPPENFKATIEKGELIRVVGL